MEPRGEREREVPLDEREETLPLRCVALSLGRWGFGEGGDMVKGGRRVWLNR